MRTRVVCSGSLGLLTAAALCTGGSPTAYGQDSVGFTDGSVKPLFEVMPVSGRKPVATGGIAGVGCEYANDDGTGDNSFGQAGAGTVGSAVGYIAVDGCTTLTAIQVAWGVVPEGQACTLQIYSDPNKDGDPTDITSADQLVSVNGVTANVDSDVFTNYVIPPTVVDGMFWVVALTADNGDDDFPMQLDGTAPTSPLNFLLLGVMDLNEPFADTVLGQDVTGPADFMVRATGDGAIVSCFGGDTNGDCAVNVTDLVNVISAWGGDGIQFNVYNADLNNDGIVDVTDLVNGVITNWGSCECTFRACCLQDGTCEDLTPDGCFRIGGSIQGPGSECASVECVNLFGACCLAPGECVENLPADCDALGGTHQGVGTNCASGVCNPPDNDLCADAMALTFGQTVSGSTTNSTADPEARDCRDETGGPQEVTAPGNWYTVTGNGNTLTATMCSSPNPYDAKIFIYCGTSCDNLFCLTSNDDGCAPGGPSEATWCSDPGQQYYVFVTGFAAGTGAYELVVTSGGACGEPTPCLDDDDICEFATNIAIGQTITGFDTCQGTPDTTAPDCGQGGQTADGRWLRVIGNGTQLTVNLCNPTPIGLNTRLSVYCGPCSALECVGTEPNNNSGCAPFTERAIWCSLPDVEYYILVSGAGNSCGPVDVSVTSNNLPCNNAPCSVACCLPNGECVITTEGNCGEMGGESFSEVTCGDIFCFQGPCDAFNTTLTQTDSDVVVAGGGVACAGGGNTTDNSFFRSFSGLGNSFEVCSINLGLETVTSSDGLGLDFVVRLYDTGLPATVGQLGTPFAQRTFFVEDQALTTITLDITGMTFTGELTVEIRREDAAANGNNFRVGGCNDPDDVMNPGEVCTQTAPSWLSSNGCNITDPTTTDAIGFPDVHWVIEVNGNN